MDIISQIEHAARNMIQYLENKGFELTNTVPKGNMVEWLLMGKDGMPMRVTIAIEEGEWIGTVNGQETRLRTNVASSFMKNFTRDIVRAIPSQVGYMASLTPNTALESKLQTIYEIWMKEIEQRLDEGSSDYFLKEVWPLVQKDLAKIIKPLGFKPRGKGKLDKSNKQMIIQLDKIDGKLPYRLVIAGSYIHEDDGEYNVYITNAQGTPHESHDRLVMDAKKDAKTVLQDIKEILQDHLNFEAM